MKFESAVQDYLRNCSISGKSVTTLESYARTLRFFGQFLSSMGVEELSAISPSTLTSWKFRQAEQVSAATLRLYVTHLKGFFDFCTDMEYLDRSPFKKKLMEVSVKDSDQKDTTSHVLTPKQFAAVFVNDFPRSTHRRAIERNRAMLALLLTSGIRCQSLARLTMADLDASSHTIRVQNAKGGKNGEILYSTLAINAVDRYLRSGYLPQDWSCDQPLFGFVDGNGIWTPYCREQLSSIVESAVRGFCGVSGFRAHAMRHTCASLLSAAGLSDGEVSTLLMHSDGTGARVTSRYIDRSNAPLFCKANEAFKQLLSANA